MTHRNHLLESMPPSSRQRITALCDGVRLPKGMTLLGAGDTVRFVYFLTSGMASMLALTSAGHTVEIASVGTDGCAGLPLAFAVSAGTTMVMMQLPGTGLRLRADALRDELRRDEGLHAAVLGYAGELFGAVGRSVVCHRFHTVLDRLCTWLLRAADHAEADTLLLTHEDLARALGASRTGLTEAAVALQDAGLIWYRRGKIVIKNRPRLERAACECYQLGRHHLGQQPTTSKTNP